MSSAALSQFGRAVTRLSHQEGRLFHLDTDRTPGHLEFTSLPAHLSAGAEVRLLWDCVPGIQWRKPKRWTWKCPDAAWAEGTGRWPCERGPFPEHKTHPAKP